MMQELTVELWLLAENPLTEGQQEDLLLHLQDQASKFTEGLTDAGGSVRPTEKDEAGK